MVSKDGEGYCGDGALLDRLTLAKPLVTFPNLWTVPADPPQYVV
jgi:hypothetical protein